MPATRIPDGAVTGDDIRFRPYMKRKAAARSTSADDELRDHGEHLGSSDSSSRDGPWRRRAWTSLGSRSARLEHREHAIGDRIAAGGIAGAEQDREESDRLLQHACSR